MCCLNFLVRAKLPFSAYEQYVLYVPDFRVCISTTYSVRTVRSGGDAHGWRCRSTVGSVAFAEIFTAPNYYIFTRTKITSALHLPARSGPHQTRSLRAPPPPSAPCDQLPSPRKINRGNLTNHLTQISRRNTQTNEAK